VAVAQDVADLVAIPVAIPAATLVVATLVAILVAILVATPVDTLQELEEVPPWLWSGQALMEEGPMEGPMEGLLMEGGPMVHTPLGPLVLSVADNQSSTWIRLACLALLLVPTFETLGKPSIGQLMRKFNTRTIKATLIAIRPPEGCVVCMDHS